MEMEFISLVADEIKVICWWTIIMGWAGIPKKNCARQYSRKKKFVQVENKHSHRMF